VVGVISECATCGDFNETFEFDIFNESGGGTCWICDDCRQKLQQSRCAVCGNRVPDDNNRSIGPHGTAPELHRHCCKSCRRGIISEEGADIR